MRIHSHSVSNLWASRRFRSDDTASVSKSYKRSSCITTTTYCYGTWSRPLLLCEKESIVNGLRTFVLEKGGESTEDCDFVVSNNSKPDYNNEDGLLKEKDNSDGDTVFNKQCRPNVGSKGIGVNRS